MRTLLLLGSCFIMSGCMKATDLQRLPPFTRVVAIPYETGVSYAPSLDGEKLPALVTFLDSLRSGWTRAYGVGFGPPSPAYYAHLYDGDKYVGYFAVGSGVLPGSAAFFQVRYGDVFAQKRVTAAEANRFLDLIGVGGELAETIDKEVRQQTAKPRSATRAGGVVEPAPKFQPDDKVRVRVTGAEGTVFLRTQFFREDRYFITFPGSQYVFETIADRTQREANTARHAAESREWARTHGYPVYVYAEYQPRQWHEEGPFYGSDLELVR
jgi:hypothetical protein